MPEERSEPAGPIKPAGDGKIPHLQPTTKDPGDESSAANATDAASSSQNQSSSDTDSERAEQELERQLESGEENPT